MAATIVRFATVGAAFAAGAHLRMEPQGLKKGDFHWPGQLLASFSAFEAEDLEEKDIKELEAEVTKLVGKGEDKSSKLAVKQMSAQLDTMIVNRKKAQIADQAKLDKSHKALENCHLDEKTKRDMNVGRAVESADDHKDDHKDSKVDHADCLEVLEAKDLLRQAYCAKVKDSEKLCKCSPSMTKFFGAKPECKDAPAIPKESQKCCEAYVYHAKHEAKCKNHKSEGQYAKLQHNIIMDKVCDAYECCYKTNLKSYTATEKSVKEAEKQRNWATLYRLKCLVGEFEKGNNGSSGSSPAIVSGKQAKACKDEKHDIKPIRYSKVPAKAKCDSTIALVCQLPK